MQCAAGVWKAPEEGLQVEGCHPGSQNAHPFCGAARWEEELVIVAPLGTSAPSPLLLGFPEEFKVKFKHDVWGKTRLFWKG